MNPFEGSLGVFDSGVGGLTVVNEALTRNPRERVLYVADQAHVPYGGRPLEEVRGFATRISHFLAASGCRAIVMACNISSAVALPSVTRTLAPLPVLGMILPAARKAAQGENLRIGVLATEGTVRSGAYEREILGINAAARVTQVACPRLVPLVEAGETDSEETESAAREYLAPLYDAGCDTVILGCTHYPFLLTVLTRVASELWRKPVRFIDPAREVAVEIPAGGNPAPMYDEAITLLTTGDASVFVEQVPRFLPYADSRVGSARWNDKEELVSVMAERGIRLK